MHRSLSFKVTLSVVLVSLISIGLVAVITQVMTASQFDNMLLERRQTHLISEIKAYYEENGTLEGVQVLFDENRTPPGGTLILRDENGKMLLPFPGHPGTPPRLMDLRFTKGVPIMVDGKKIAVISTSTPQEWRRPEDVLVLRRINQGLWLAAGGAMVLATVIGIILSRMLTRPVRELTLATRAMAPGNLEQQVPVRTHDELGELAAAFNQMGRDLNRSISLRKQMTADIAHDLRTPLTVIKGYTEALRDGDLPATQETFEVMYQESTLLSHLIEDLRTLSLADAGELTLNQRQVKVTDLLEPVQAAWLPQARKQGVEITINIADNVTDLNVDAERLNRVLNNLVSNALRHTPAGGTITLWAKQESGATLLGVSDTGSGIAEQDLPHIFERFYRGDSSRSDGESGLGLPIARSLVEAHGGTITVDSALGKGTTFAIRLPGA